MLNSTSIYQKFAKDAAVIGIAQLILRLKSLILLPLVARILGAADYGIWIQAGITLSLIAGFCELGISFAFIRFFAGETDKKKIRQGFFAVFITVFSLSCVGALILFLFATSVAQTFFGGKEATNIVWLCAVILPFFSINNLFLFFFRTFRKMNLYALLMLTQGFGEVALAAGLILAGWDIFGAMLAMLIAYFVSELVMLFIIIKQIGVSFPPLASFAKIKDYIRFGLPLIPGDFALWIANTSDRYVIALFLGISFTGIYSAAYGLGGIVAMYMSPLNLVLVPTLAYLYDNHRVQDIKVYLFHSLKYFLLLAIPSTVGVSLLAKPILQVLATPEFGSAGAIVTPFVAMSFLLRGCYGIIYQPLLLAKKTRILGIVWGIAATLNLGLNLLLIPRLGIIAAAITTLISFAVATGIACYVSFKYLRFDIDWVFILKSLSATAVMSGIILLFNPTGVLDLLLTTVAGAVVYFIVIYLMRGISPKEIAFFKGLMVSPGSFGRIK